MDMLLPLANGPLLHQCMLLLADWSCGLINTASATAQPDAVLPAADTEKKKAEAELLSILFNSKPQPTRAGQDACLGSRYTYLR